MRPPLSQILQAPAIADLLPLVVAALREDHADADATTQATVDVNQRLRARIVARQRGIVCGTTVLECVFRQLDAAIGVRGCHDGAAVDRDTLVWEVAGRAGAIHAAERVALNFVQQLSGLATLPAHYDEALAGTDVAITDTRKTTPLLRQLEKYAVVCGGGVNHRMHLADMLLIKENHIAAAGSVTSALRRAQQAAAGRPIEIEVRTLAEYRQALACRPQRVLLDHWSVPDIATAIDERQGDALPQIEVSGNLELNSIRRYALPGVSFLAVGRLTHSAPVLDLSLLAETLS
jgi:nicotinate-nucleotide pyrophosphorylase (carboxylating)